VLKSGCKVGGSAHRSALRLQRSLTIHLVTAWCLMVLTLLGRSVPELEASVFLPKRSFESLRIMPAK